MLTSQQLAYCLSSWMSPGVLARAAADWADRPNGHEIVFLRIANPVLKDAREARFDWFVSEFLQHVVIPEELVTFTAGLYPRQVSRDAADWLRRFTFTGTVQFNPANETSPVEGAPVLAKVAAPLCETRVVWPPIEMLNRLLSVKAAAWRRVAMSVDPAEVHHEANSEWSFDAWIDLQVARASGFPDIGRAGVQPERGLFENLRGRVSIAGALPRNEAELDAMTLAAKLYYRDVSKSFDLHRRRLCAGSSSLPGSAYAG